MASHTPDLGRASALPFPAVLASIPSYPRPVLERLVARLIEHLDEEDGDSDFEPGDEPGSPDAWSDGLPGDVEDAEDGHDREDIDEREPDDVGGIGFHGLDQRDVTHWGGKWRDE
jgi:hypothetical protein